MDIQRYIFSNGRMHSNNEGPYLISMFNGQFVMISAVKDFNLILSPGNSYDLALTEVAIAI